MPLYERLLGTQEPKLPVHQFLAAVAENTRGQMTNAQVISAFALDATEQTEAIALRDRVTTGPTGSRLTRELIHDVLLLAEQQIPPYDTVAAVKSRFGV